MIKKVIISLLILLLAIGGLLFWGLKSLAIEDIYGDLQDVYWASESGDLILNNHNSKRGIIELNNCRIYVKEGEQLIGLEEWLDPDGRRKFHVSIYQYTNSVKKQEDFRVVDIGSCCELVTELNVQY